MGSDNDKTHDNGLPVMPASEDGGRATKFIVIATVVTLFISGAIGYGIASNGKYDTKIKEIVAQDLHYVFAALVVLSQTVSFVNMYPLIAKSRIMKQNSGNLRTNMAVFKVRTCARSFAWQYKIALISFVDDICTSGNWQGCAVQLRCDGNGRSVTLAHRDMRCLSDFLPFFLLMILSLSYL